MKVSDRKVGFRFWAVRAAMLVALLMALVFSQNNKGTSVQATDSASVPPAFDAREVFANTCLMPEAQQEGAKSLRAEPPLGSEVLGGDVPSVRSVLDPYPAFTAVAVDPENNLALLTDANKKSVLIYDRAAGSKSATETKPLRQIIGNKTLGGYFSGMIADGARREIFAVNNDVEDCMVVYSYDDAGNVTPKRVLGVSHGAYGLALSKARDEIAMTIQDCNVNAVLVYKREANGLDAPLRGIQGRKTELADPHGIYFDDANNEIIVSNWGSWNVPLRRFAPPEAFPPRDLPGGTYQAPSITVYPATAEGDVAPLRKIQGSATQLNWPAALDVDPVSKEIAVANNGDHSILIFPSSGNGNLKPSRIIRGARTGINTPMSVAIDRKNNELWVANFGDHTAVIFDLKSNGNVAPKRVIRNAPAGTPSVGMGNPMSVTYDAKRDELLVPN
jgi:DNA-binding beta-propeller fold protein YncE